MSADKHYYIYEETKGGRIEYYSTSGSVPPNEKLEEFRADFKEKKFVLVESEVAIKYSNEYFCNLLIKGTPVELYPLMNEMKPSYSPIEIFDGFQPLGFIAGNLGLLNFFRYKNLGTNLRKVETELTREQYDEHKEDQQEFQGYNFYRRDDSMFGYFEHGCVWIWICN